MKISWHLLVEEYRNNLGLLGWGTLKQFGKHKDFDFIAWVIQGFWDSLDNIWSFGIVWGFLVGRGGGVGGGGYWNSLEFLGLSVWEQFWLIQGFWESFLEQLRNFKLGVLKQSE